MILLAFIKSIIYFSIPSDFFLKANVYFLHVQYVSINAHSILPFSLITPVTARIFNPKPAYLF